MSKAGRKRKNPWFKLCFGTFTRAVVTLSIGAVILFTISPTTGTSVIDSLKQGGSLALASMGGLVSSLFGAAMANLAAPLILLGLMIYGVRRMMKGGKK